MLEIEAIQCGLASIFLAILSVVGGLINFPFTDRGSCSDFDTAVESGYYVINSNALHIPEGFGSSGVMIVAGSSRKLQLAINANGNLYRRVETGVTDKFSVQWIK